MTWRRQLTRVMGAGGPTFVRRKSEGDGNRAKHSGRIALMVSGPSFASCCQHHRWEAALTHLLLHGRRRSLHVFWTLGGPAPTLKILGGGQNLAHPCLEKSFISKSSPRKISFTARSKDNLKNLIYDLTFKAIPVSEEQDQRFNSISSQMCRQTWCMFIHCVQWDLRPGEWA